MASTRRDSRLFASATKAAVAGTGLIALDRIYAIGNAGPFKALGGSCGNVLVSLAMLGHHVAPVITIGTDSSGDFLHEEFKRAGCDTQLIFRSADHHSPVIVEHVDPVRASHWFSFVCPETSRDLPRWRSVDDEHVRSANSLLEEVAVFYVDRLSSAIVEAMEKSRNSGALVFFEPAGRGEEALLARAMRAASIVKLSDETVGAAICAEEIQHPMLVIRTHGAQGLTATFNGKDYFFPALKAPRLIDTCGSGDMVTTGLLDRLLKSWTNRDHWTLSDIKAGIEAGQRLAALNCAFAGARGAFHALGSESIRAALDTGLGATLVSRALQHGPYEGYEAAL